VAASFFFTWVVGFLINKILWVVGDNKIKISCLVGKLKPTQLKFNDSSILITIISWDYLNLSVANEYIGDVTI
jgi:hypothetical protein